MGGLKDGPRIVCVGANLESEVVLRGFLERNVPVEGLVTLPPRRSEAVSDYVDLHPWCAGHGIAVHDTVDINSTETVAVVRDWAPEYIFTLGWSQIFQAALLDAPVEYVVGSHPSPLPAGRGRAPVPWTILQKLSRTAVTLFRMDSGVDSGPILIQKTIDVPPRSYALELYHLIAGALRDAFCDLYEDIRADRVTAKPQDESSASHRSKRTPADGHIDFNRPAEAVETLVRAVSHPYPGAYAYFNDRPVHIWRATIDDVPDYCGVPGQVLLRSDQRLLVQSGDAPVWLEEFTDGDGKPLAIETFRVGTTFNYRIQDEIFALRKEVERLKQNLNE